MAIRNVRCAIMGGLLTCGVVGMVPANGRAQDATDLPKSGDVTLVGCFARERFSRGIGEQYILAHPTLGPATSVPEATCSADTTGRLIKLEKLKKRHLETVNLGTWVEVTGNLRGNKRHIHSDMDLQDIHVTSIRAVPVVPRVAEAPPAPELPKAMPETAPPAAPQAEAPAPAPAPVATTGVKEEKHRLPHTASSLPLAGLLGLVALAGGVALLVDRRRAMDRG